MDLIDQDLSKVIVNEEKHMKNIKKVLEKIAL